jgi:hypothetical protein
MDIKANLEIPAPGERDSDQVAVWDREVRSEINPQTDAKLEASEDIRVNGDRVFFLKYRSGRGYVLGSRNSIRKRIRRPECLRPGDRRHARSAAAVRHWHPDRGSA